MKQIRAHQLAEWLSDESQTKPLLLDVREPWEIEMCCLPGVKNFKNATATPFTSNQDTDEASCDASF